MDIAQKTKQERPDSGSTLEDIFVNFTKLISRGTFFFIAKILVLMVFGSVLPTTDPPDASAKACHTTGGVFATAKQQKGRLFENSEQ